MEHLQMLQLSKVRDIAHYFKPHPIGWKRNPVHVGAFVKLAGVFWKNSLILDDPEDILGVLEVLQKSSFMMLLPHLNEWVHRHARLEEKDENIDFDDYRMKESQSQDVLEVTFGYDAKGSRYVWCGSYSARIYTISGLYRGIYKQTLDIIWDQDEYGAPLPSDEKLREFQAQENHECRTAFPIIRLVDDAKPETWWIFRWIYADGEEWLLINFEEQIFWHRHMGNVVCLWNSGDGMWDPEQWALAEADRQDQPTKTILEVLEETGVCVDNDGNRESKEDDTESDTDESDKGGDEDKDEGSDRVYKPRQFWALKPDLSDRFFVAFSKAFK